MGTLVRNGLIKYADEDVYNFLIPKKSPKKVEYAFKESIRIDSRIYTNIF